MKTTVIKNIINALFFQIGWWVCVLYGSTPALFFTALYLGAHALFFISSSKEMWLIMFITLIGLALDYLLLNLGVLNSQQGTPELWMLCIWILFSTSILHSLHWLNNKLVLASLLGAVSGPLSYWAGVKLTHIEFGIADHHALIVLAVLWAILTPLIFTVAVKLQGSNTHVEYIT